MMKWIRTWKSNGWVHREKVKRDASRQKTAICGKNSNDCRVCTNHLEVGQRARRTIADNKRCICWLNAKPALLSPPQSANHPSDNPNGKRNRACMPSTLKNCALHEDDYRTSLLCSMLLCPPFDPCENSPFMFVTLIWCIPCIVELLQISVLTGCHPALPFSL